MSAPSETNAWNHVYSGKVRDLYEPADGPDDVLLVVASDRVSAFDHVLEPGIPGKGELLTSLSLWWFDQLREVPNHLVPDHELDAAGLAVARIPEEFAGRAMLVRKLDMFPVECVVRGYLTGSGWKEYVANRTVCGIPLPDGLRDGDQLPEPLFTPAYKAPLGEHDENISFSRMVELIGEDDAVALKDLSLDIYRTASITAERHGVILADTKFEFGRNPATGAITLGDEVLTSDSSRYWDRDVYLAGDDLATRLASFDKQIVRNWLAHNWDQADEATPVPPTLPSEIVTQTAARYRELLERLTGRPYDR